MATNNADNFSNPIAVNTGGTGLSSTTAYGVMCGGTTTTAPLQNAGSGTGGTEVLTSTGSTSLPTWQVSSLGGSWTLLSTITANNTSKYINFDDTIITSAYTTYVFVLNTLTINSPYTNTPVIGCARLNGGASIQFTGGFNYNAYNSNSLSNSYGSLLYYQQFLPQSAGPFSSVIFLYLPAGNNASMTAQTFGNVSGTPTYSYCSSYSSPNSGVINWVGFQGGFFSGNWLTGTISCYGVSS